MAIAARAWAGIIFRPAESGQRRLSRSSCGSGLYCHLRNRPIASRKMEAIQRDPADRAGTGAVSDLLENLLQKFLENIDYLGHDKKAGQR